MFYTALRNKFLEYLTAKTKTITGSGYCYLGFSSTTPNADGTNITEPSSSEYPSYKRIRLNVNSAMPYTDVFTTVSNGQVTNKVELTTPECKEEGGWPTFTHFVIFDQETGGNALAGDSIVNPDGDIDSNGSYPATTLTVPKNHVAVIRIGAINLKFNG